MCRNAERTSVFLVQLVLQVVSMLWDLLVVSNSISLASVATFSKSHFKFDKSAQHVAPPRQFAVLGSRS